MRLVKCPINVAEVIKDVARDDALQEAASLLETLIVLAVAAHEFQLRDARRALVDLKPHRQIAAARALALRALDGGPCQPLARLVGIHAAASVQLLNERVDLPKIVPRFALLLQATRTTTSRPLLPRVIRDDARGNLAKEVDDNVHPGIDLTVGHKLPEGSDHNFEP